MSNHPSYDFSEPPIPLVPQSHSVGYYSHQNNFYANNLTTATAGMQLPVSPFGYVEEDNEDLSYSSRSGSEDISTPGPSGTVFKNTNKGGKKNNGKNNNMNMNHNNNNNNMAAASVNIASDENLGDPDDLLAFGETAGGSIGTTGGKRGGAAGAAGVGINTSKVFKDEDALNKYLKRRQNNNAAACKSRMKKKEMEMQNVERANKLEAENMQLRSELQQLEFEAKYLKEVLQSVLSKKTGN